MGRVKRLSNGREYRLTPVTNVGRTQTCELRLDNIEVSSQHAILRWDGEHWRLQDLASQNGTLLGDERVIAGERRILAKGARFTFAHESELFELIDASPPQALARTERGDEEIGEDGLLFLPSAEQPEVTISLSEVGTWLAEWNDGTCRPAFAGMSIEVGGETWRLEVPSVPESTLKATEPQFSLGHLMMRFRVSRDEETVSATLSHRGQTWQLKPLAHMYLLLTLARARLADREDPELVESEHGWVYVPDLLRMLNTSEGTLNVEVCRARRHLAKVGVPTATAVIERRQGARKIRIGVANIEVERL